jgi:hypothetical protein
MTDREKLIEILNVPIHPRLDVDPLEAVADYLLDNGVTFQKWIPVSERLPDKDGTYICFNRGAYGKWTQAVRFTKDARKFDEYTFKNKWKNQWLMYDSEYGYYAVDSITHWMPLPNPPKEE